MRTRITRRTTVLGASTIAAALIGESGTRPSARANEVNSNPIQPSPEWKRALPPGPDTRVKITEGYANLVARDVYFWAWPMVKRVQSAACLQRCERFRYGRPCANSATQPICDAHRLRQSGSAACRVPESRCGLRCRLIALDISPVVVQVPDFGGRFWVYQMVDLRTDGFVQLGNLYGTTLGLYLLVGPDWHGETPKGINVVFRSSTNTGFAAPRIFMDDTREDRLALQSVLPQVMMYPLSEYDGTMKSYDWSKIPKVAGTTSGAGEAKWVFPDKFFDELLRRRTTASGRRGALCASNCCSRRHEI